MKKAVLILHDIRSVYNVGAIFRTADAVGISKVYLSGYTPTPVDRFGRKRGDFHKSALGAEESLPWESVDDAFSLLGELKGSGYEVVALEQDKSSIDYKDVSVGEKVAIVLGSEVGGMDPKLLELCDVVAEIPMRGMKDSLNVSVAAGVFMYRLLDK